MTNRKSEPQDQDDDPLEVRLVMGPGLVRRGLRLIERRGHLSAAFRSDEPHYLAVGSRVKVGSDQRPRPMVVVRRCDRKSDRVYDFRDESDAADALHETASRPRPPFVRKMDLAFGQLAVQVTSLWIDAPRIGVSVSLEDEQHLAAADLVELRIPLTDGHPPARIWGWIRERHLAARRVAYSIDCARTLSEHFDADWRRITDSTEQAIGES